jgi:hypothetical protein
MREGRIILPVNGNDGEPLLQVHVALRKALVQEFGGFTAVDGAGGWVNADGVLVSEPVTVYDVAGDYPMNYALRSIAAEFATLAGQDCVYCRDFDGNVELVAPAKFSAVA